MATAGSADGWYSRNLPFPKVTEPEWAEITTEPAITRACTVPAVKLAWKVALSLGAKVASATFTFETVLSFRDEMKFRLSLFQSDDVLLVAACVRA